MNNSISVNRTNYREAAAELQSLISELPEWRREFAKSLSSTAQTAKYELTEKQIFWIDKLLTIALEGDEPPPKIEVGELSGLVAFLTDAKPKYPKLTLHMPEGTLKISKSGDKSKKPGWLNLTDGKPYGHNKWYGRVSPDGHWEQSSVGSDNAYWILPVLVEFHKDSLAATKKYGHASGHCIFCNRSLTDDKSGKSVEFGYGPVCAKRYNLPYGVKAAQKAAVDAKNESLNLKVPNENS